MGISRTSLALNFPSKIFFPLETTARIPRFRFATARATTVTQFRQRSLSSGNRNAVESSSPGLPSAATLGNAMPRSPATATRLRPTAQDCHSAGNLGNGYPGKRDGSDYWATATRLRPADRIAIRGYPRETATPGKRDGFDSSATATRLRKQPYHSKSHVTWVGPPDKQVIHISGTTQCLNHSQLSTFT
jgi:hypothetical protein